ncbi:hypothetical protein [Pendulispora albinea]|uniref:Uncharacterized protein n=1 Tax=Pendulispora albinea TaxID=2741071 RepID=A0ABZ2LTN3_9BACT
MRAVPFAMFTMTAVAGLGMVACGGEPKGAASPAPPVADAGAKTAAAPPSALPFVPSNVPMAPMPPPFRYGSQKAEKKPLPSSGTPACRDAFASPAPASDPAGQLQRLAKACSDKMHPAGAPVSGTQAQGAPAQSIKLKAESGRCYRVYAAAAPAVKNLVVVVTDSAGAVVWESRTEEARVAAPEDGALCFKANDDAQVTVSVGSGEGAYAVQIWSD